MGSSPRTSTLLLHERLANLTSSKMKIFHDTAGWKHLETWMKWVLFYSHLISRSQFATESVSLTVDTLTRVLTVHVRGDSKFLLPLWVHFSTGIFLCRCLQSVIDGCEVNFNSQVDQMLLDLIFTALTHTNRFVRETGYQVCASLVSCNSHLVKSGTILCHPVLSKLNLCTVGQ